MDGNSKCQLTACQCRTEGGRSYCSADCEQAASQGVEREFCQCPHPGCTSAGQDFLQVDATDRVNPLGSSPEVRSRFLTAIWTTSLGRCWRWLLLSSVMSGNKAETVTERPSATLCDPNLSRSRPSIGLHEETFEADLSRRAVASLDGFGGRSESSQAIQRGCRSCDQQPISR